ncbi:dihydroneopterin aldolase [Coxiella endosymbiont of Amblyomma americanum]|uniref:dihydroneopterin aldolase n=1 Tax=Coxiella endosymbiont of Amblyomma americanum TaxID=325775 RepID=UPI00057D589B|nr:dihydroneopterin aldolase [Coxiella endosymbiont of Amblyomma americanum]AJC50371.1 diguanylate cyclase [Coxiella endosymbiont of Amblyomma americanum]AUJ58715.1 dihydroneopterin aldolase [Coxiella-like endosymbiont of Amblyomma americanum]
MDKLFIRNLKVLAQLGILPHERASSQIINLDVFLGIDSKLSGISDDLSVTVDYAVVRSGLIEFFSNRRFNLVETLANRCAAFLFSEFSLVHWVQLRITKLSVFDDADGVGIVIERIRTK